MTSREELIKEAAKAMLDDSHGEGTWEHREQIEEELYLRRARAALAVFEKAHAPTDDEREALAYLITAHRFRERGLSGAIGEPEVAVARPLADFLVAEGFRRSEVPEPSAEQPKHLCAAHPFGCPEPQGEPSDAQRHARARLQARIHEEHAPHFHLGQCKCGAKLGDSIDWNWHLTGAALRAAGGVR